MLHSITPIGCEHRRRHGRDHAKALIELLQARARQGARPAALAITRL